MANPEQKAKEAKVRLGVKIEVAGGADSVDVSRVGKNPLLSHNAEKYVHVDMKENDIIQTSGKLCNDVVMCMQMDATHKVRDFSLVPDGTPSPDSLENMRVIAEEQAQQLLRANPEGRFMISITGNPAHKELRSAMLYAALLALGVDRENIIQTVSSAANNNCLGKEKGIFGGYKESDAKFITKFLGADRVPSAFRPLTRPFTKESAADNMHKFKDESKKIKEGEKQVVGNNHIEGSGVTIKKK